VFRPAGGEAAQYHSKRGYNDAGGIAPTRINCIPAIPHKMTAKTQTLQQESHVVGSPGGRSSGFNPRRERRNTSFLRGTVFLVFFLFFVFFFVGLVFVFLFFKRTDPPNH